MRYEDFCTEEELTGFHAVKHKSMRFHRLLKEEACDLTGGYIGDPMGGRKQFVITRLGVFRLGSTNSDNSTEIGAHHRMGAVKINVTNDKQMRAWFAAHGVDNAELTVRIWKSNVRLRMRRND